LVLWKKNGNFAVERMVLEDRGTGKFMFQGSWQLMVNGSGLMMDDVRGKKYEGCLITK
jgi:hypothetical protein